MWSGNRGEPPKQKFHAYEILIWVEMQESTDPRTGGYTAVPMLKWVWYM